MHDADERLKAYARERLAGLDPDAAELAERFVQSAQFSHLIAVFDKNLARQLASYSRANPPEEIHLEPMIFKPATPALPAADAAVADATAAALPAPADATLPDAPAPEPLPAAPEAALVFRLRNARAGDAYAHALEPLLAPGKSLDYSEMTLPDELGMTADLATGMLSGTPHTAGEFDIAIGYRIHGQPDAALMRATVKLVVTPDPKKMWRNVPSDQSDRYWKPDEAAASAASADFELLAASKRGRSHAHVGSFRDDDFRLGVFERSGWQVAVVADGAGSARHSRRGAQIICDEAMKHLDATLNGSEGAAIDEAALEWSERRFDQDPAVVEAARQGLHYKLFGTVGHAAYYGVKEIARETAASADTDAEASAKDFASTALIAACKRYPFGTLCVAYWVGDGAIGVYRKGQDITLLGDVDSGEFSGQTRFLDAGEVTQESLVRRTRFLLADEPTALILMSDGVSDPIFETDARLARVALWDSLWDDLAQAVGLPGAAKGREEQLLAWLDFWSPGNHDDRTIAIIYQGSS
jgi:hypothetical protein